MSGLSVVVYDYNSMSEIDVTPRTISVSTSESIGGTASASVTLKDLSHTHARGDLTVRYGGETIYSGIIESQSDSVTGGERLFRSSVWQAKDDSLRLENRLVNKRYEDMLVEEIIADLLVMHPCGITGENVKNTNVLIDEITFQHVTLYDCIKQLAGITGWRWYVDAYRDLHFFDTDEGVGDTVFSTRADGGFTRNILADSIELDSYIDDKTANRVWIIGAKEASQKYTEQFYMGDGQNRVFSVSFIPNYPEVYENGVKVTVEVDRGSTSDKAYVYNKDSRVFTRVAGPLPAGVSLRIRYRPTVQVIDYFEDPSSIARYGVYEKAIKDRTIKEKMAARARGRAELRKRSNAIRTISFDTRELSVYRGKRYRIVIPELSIDSYWLCTEVTTSIAAPARVNVEKSVTMEEIS